MQLFELLLALGSALFIGTSDYLSQALSRRHGPLAGLLAFSLFAIPPLLLILPFSEAHAEAVLPNLPLFALFASSYLLGYVLFFRAVRKGLLSVVSPISATWPLVTISIGLFFYGEALSALQFCGGLLAIAGVMLASASGGGRRKGWLAEGSAEALGAALLWGIGLGSVKPIVLSVGPVLSTLMLFVFMASVLWLWLRSPLRAVAGSLDRGAALASLFLVLGWLAGNYAIITVPISLFSPISATYSLVTVALAYAFSRERPTVGLWAGVLMAVAGVVLLSL